MENTQGSDDVVLDMEVQALIMITPIVKLHMKSQELQASRLVSIKEKRTVLRLIALNCTFKT